MNGLGRRRRLESKSAGGGSATARWLAPAAFAVLAGITLGPLLRGGYLLLLDAPAGPNPPAPSLLPAPSDGAGAILAAPVAWLLHVVGSVGAAAVNKTLIGLAVFLAGYGLYRTLHLYLNQGFWSALVGGIFYAINPFVYQRAQAGHLLLLVGYSLLAWLLPSLIGIASSSRSAVPPAFAAALIGVVSPHMGGIAIFLVVVTAAISVSSLTRKVKAGASAIGVFIFVNAFWILPSQFGGEVEGLAPGDVSVYASRPHGVGVIAQVLMLHGFWRRELASPLEATPLLSATALGCILALAGLGAWSMLRDDRGRRVGAGLTLAAGVAVILAVIPSLDSTRPLAEAAYRSVPGFALYREPQKWLALVALAYAVSSAYGVQTIADAALQRSGLVARVVPALALLPLIATHQLLWGLGPRIDVSQLPTSWEQAAEVVEHRRGAVLVLPWSLYLPVEFADGRVVADPAAAIFPTQVISSVDPGFSRGDVTVTPDPRTPYVADLIDRREEIADFGQRIAPLGARYVFVIDVGDKGLTTFLDRQKDLRLVASGKGASLFENEAYRGSTYDLGAGARSLAPRSPYVDDTSVGGPGVVRLLPFWDEVDTAGAEVVGTTLPCTDGWRLDDVAPVCHVGVASAFLRLGSTGTLWRPGAWLQIVGYAISALTILAIGTIILIRSFRDKRSANARA